MHNKKRIKHFYIGFAGLLLAGFLFVLCAPSANAVRVSMKRVIFDGSKRSEILTIINNDPEPKTYRLGWRRYRMVEGMALQAVKDGEDDSDIKWADDMIRFAPRRVTVPPGGSQQIRLLLRRPKDIQVGEYRSHLWIVTETKPQEFTADAKNKQAVRLTVQPAISLPLFVRHGDLSATATITDAKLFNGKNGLGASFTLNRTGNRSLYGDFDFICKDGGQNLVLKQVRGIAVYTEATRRKLSFDISHEGEGAASNCRTVQIVYRADANDSDYAGEVMAEATATF